MSLPLIPGRDCGGCVECCRVIPLNLPELAKPTGELCGYCIDGAGCSVHAIRPQTCRVEPRRPKRVARNDFRQQHPQQFCLPRDDFAARQLFGICDSGVHGTRDGNRLPRPHCHRHPRRFPVIPSPL